jgi:predicted ATPase/DNA-binding SARP family transcriptional activator
MQEGAGWDGRYNDGDVPLRGRTLNHHARRALPSLVGRHPYKGDRMLRLHLFGAPRIERDSAALPLRRGKALALLAHLATTGRPHTREALAALLWPEFPDADARNNLRRELSILRAALGHDALAADRNQVAWVASPRRWVDVAAFAALLASARAHAHPAGLCDACAASLGEAVALAQADLLDGYSLADSSAFEEWLFFEREELRQQLAWALESLLGWHERRGELSPALALARRWQALDPLHEPARRALMRLMAHAGQPAAALRHYDELARLLAAELDARPEPATAALAAAIKSRQLAPLLDAPAVSEPAAPAPPLTSFIGRRHELAALRERLADPACRLLSLVGPGGVGKTRLAAELARLARPHFPDGVTLVALSGTLLPAHLPGALAAALGLPLVGDGWAELAAALSERKQLLVLDNFEQLLEAAALLARLLHAAPGLTLLVTSREALGLQEEWLWPLAGLEAPEEGAAAPDQADAVQLFLARARQRGGEPGAELDAVAQICRLVGGMPLALELAATWVPALSCAEIAAELAGGLELLATERQSVPARQRSIQAVFDQSWARLAPALQRALARLSVFPAGSTREAAAMVAGASAPVLAQLVERALLRRTPAGRYELHPLMRQYAGQRLAAAPEEARVTAEACGRYFARFLCAQFVRTNSEETAVEATLAVRAERENLRTAMPALLAQASGEPLRQALQMILDVYFTCGPYQEGVEALELAEAHLRAVGDVEAGGVRAHVLNGLGLFAVRQGRAEAARSCFEASCALFAALGAEPRQGDATDPQIGLGILCLVAGDYRAAERFAAQVRARNEATGQRRNLAYAWYLRAEAAQAQGLLGAAHAAAHQALALTRAAGAVWFSAYVRNQLGQIAAALGRYDEADGHFQVSYASRAAFADYEGMAIGVLGLADSAARRGEHGRAVERFAESLSLYERVGDRGGRARALLGLGTSLAALGDHARAWEHIRGAVAQARALEYQHVVLDGLVHAAALVAADRPWLATAPLALALVHPATRHDTGLRAQELLAGCAASLPPADFAAAVARGRAALLDTLVEELLATPLTAA